MNEKYESGKTYNFEIVSIEAKEHRLGLAATDEKAEKKEEEVKEEKEDEEKEEKSEDEKADKKDEESQWCFCPEKTPKIER